VQERLRDVLRRTPHPNAWNIAVIVSDDPQLAVVKGLLEDRRQQYDTGSNCLTTRIARASYGVVCKYLYNPLVHKGEDIEDDQYKNGIKWALNQIDWFVKKVIRAYRRPQVTSGKQTADSRKGDELNTNHSYIERLFQRKVIPGNSNREWDAHIVTSDNPRENLPLSMKRRKFFAASPHHRTDADTISPTAQRALRDCVPSNQTWRV
jgi:hypothetical protein